MTNVLVITNSISGGGAERSMNLLVNALYSRLPNLILVPINQSSSEVFSLVAPIIEINRVYKSSVISTFKSWMTFQIQIFKLRPDVLILNCDLPEFYGAITFTRARIICVEHSNHPWHKRKILGTVIRLILKLRGVIWVAVSNHLNIWPLQTKPNFIINNLVWKSDLDSESFTGSIKRLVFLGRLHEEKNPKLFLEIAYKTGLSAVIIGDGELRYELESLAQSKGVDAEFKGFVPDPWSLLTTGDLLIITSRWEGDGLVALEAIERGVPLILSKIHAFKRFNLPDINYAEDQQDYIYSILQNKNQSELFRVSPEKKAQILGSRSAEDITSKWFKLINSIVKNS